MKTNTYVRLTCFARPSQVTLPLYRFAKAGRVKAVLEGRLLDDVRCREGIRIKVDRRNGDPTLREERLNTSPVVRVEDGYNIRPGRRAAMAGVTPVMTIRADTNTSACWVQVGWIRRVKPSPRRSEHRREKVVQPTKATNDETYLDQRSAPGIPLFRPSRSFAAFRCRASTRCASYNWGYFHRFFDAAAPLPRPSI